MKLPDIFKVKNAFIGCVLPHAALCSQAVNTHNRPAISNWQFYIHGVSTNSDMKKEHPVYADKLHAPKGLVYSHLCWTLRSRRTLKTAIPTSRCWWPYQGHTAGLSVTFCAERSLLAVMRTPQQQTQLQTVTHDTTVHNLAHTHTNVSCLWRFFIKLQVFIAAPMLVQLSDKSR